MRLEQRKTGQPGPEAASKAARGQGAAGAVPLGEMGSCAGF